MSTKQYLIDPELHAYAMSVSLDEHPVLAALRAETASHPEVECQISPDEGQFLALLVRAMGVRRALEVGVFTGYSSTAVALALPPDGKLVACDISEEYTAVARRYWQQAGVADKIDLRIGPAVDTLARMVDSGLEGTFDFAFIDADKVNYENYYQYALRLLRPRGVMAFDNVYQHGKIQDANDPTESVRIMRRFNETLHKDPRVTLSMVSVADGVTLALKR